MRKKEHIGCSCQHCQRGLRTAWGHFIVKQTNRKIRRTYNEMLRRDPDNAMGVTIGTPYTD